MLASLDTRRPAAILQLQQLAERVGAAWHPSTADDAPLAIARAAVEAARRSQAGVLVLDTAGRTRLDDELLQELKVLHAEIQPQETLFVVDSMAGQVDEKNLRRQVALINSMTPRERRFPKIINGSRKRRIAAGAGVAVPEVNRLLKQHTQMQKMMKRMSKGGMKRALRGMPGLPGR